MDYFKEAVSYAGPLLSDAWQCTNSTLEKFEKWQLVILTAAVVYLIFCAYEFWENELDKGLLYYIKSRGFKLVRNLPFVRSKIKQEIQKTEKSLNDEVIRLNKGQSFIETMPAKPSSQAQVLGKIDEYLKLSGDLPWKEGACSGGVFAVDQDLEELTTKIYSKYAWANALHADVFPDVRKMEAEVVRWVCTLFNGDENACGTMSSGGTESIMLACRAYRQRAFAKGIRKPEMVVPETAHPSFDKAADFFQMKIHHVPVDPKTRKASVKSMKSYINSNTCMIVGSAPQFPHGAIDPIEDLSKLAVKYDVPLHVDACFGGFLIIFMRAAGFDMPKFDFSLPGVTSISCDTHKYGYTPKGSSIIMYRNPELRRYQYFSMVEWPGGIYASPTFAGSRSGSVIAMTWGTLFYIGFEGYVNITRDIINTTRYIAKELRKVAHIEVICEPEVSIVTIISSHFNILNMLDEMSARGWHLNACQKPPGIQIALTKTHTLPGVKERYVKDVTESVASIMARDDRKLGKKAAIYCSAQSMPESIVTDVTHIFLDSCYTTQNVAAVAAPSSELNGAKRVKNGKK